jgi:hypothetical protein
MRGVGPRRSPRPVRNREALRCAPKPRDFSHVPGLVQRLERLEAAFYTRVGIALPDLDATQSLALPMVWAWCSRLQLATSGARNAQPRT